MAGGKIQGITIEIAGDTTKLSTALTNSEKNLKSMATELKSVQAGLKFDPSNMELLGQKATITKDEIDNLSDKLKILVAGQKELDEQLNSGSISTEKYTLAKRELARELIITESRLSGLDKSLDITNDKLSNNGVSVKEFGDGLSETSNKVNLFGEILKANLASEVITRGIGLIAEGISAIGPGAVKASIGFESAFTGVEKTVNGTNLEMAKLKDGIRDLAKDIPSTANAIAGVGEIAGQLGIATNNILDFSKVVIGLEQSTNLTAEMAASSMAKFANVTGMSQKEFSNYGSTIVALGNNFATTEADIVAMSSRLSGAGTAAKISQANILGIATALSSVGIEAEAGGSAVSKTIVNMQLAISRGGNDLQKYGDVIGITGEQFKKAFEENAANALNMFVEAVGKAESQGKNMIGILDEMGITEIRERDAILRLANAHDLLGNSLDASNIAWAENTALSAETEKKYATTASQIEILKNVISDIGITIGSAVLPALNSMTEGFQEFASDNQEEITNVANAIGGFMGLVVDNAPAVTLGVIGIAGAFVTLEGATVATNIALLANPFTAIAVGIAATAIAINSVIKAQDEARQSFLETGDRVEELTQKITESTANSANINSLTAEYSSLKTTLDSNVLSANELVTTKERLKEVEDLLIANSDGLITKGNAEIGITQSLLDLTANMTAQKAEMFRLELEHELLANPIEKQKAEQAALQEKYDKKKALYESEIEDLNNLQILQREVEASFANNEPINTQTAAYKELSGTFDFIGTGLNGIIYQQQEYTNSLNDSKEELNTYQTELDLVSSSIEKSSAAQDFLNGITKDTTAIIKENSEATVVRVNNIDLITNALRSATKEQELNSEEMKVQTSVLADLTSAFMVNKESIKLSEKQAEMFRQTFPDLNNAIDENGNVMLSTAGLADALANSYKTSNKEQLQAVLTATQGMMDQTKIRIENMKAELKALETLASGYYVSAGLAIEMSKKNGQITEATAEYEKQAKAAKALEERLKSLTIETTKTTPTVSTGGGGATTSAKKIINERLEAELAFIEEKKAIGELSKQQEVERLDTVLSTYKLNTEEKKKVEASLYKAKVENSKEFVTTVKSNFKEEIEAAKEKINQQIEILSNAQKDEIEITVDGSKQKIELYNDEYIAKVRAVSEPAALALEAANSEIRKQIEIISLTDADRAAKLTNIQNQIDGINTVAETEKKARENAIANETRLRLVKAIETAKESEDKKNAIKELADYDSERSAKVREEQRKKTLEELETLKKETIKNATEKTKEANEAIKTENEKSKETLKQEVVVLKTGQFDVESEKQSLKSLDEVYANFVKTAEEASKNLVKYGKDGQDKALKILEEQYPNWKKVGTGFMGNSVEGVKEKTPALIESTNKAGVDAGQGLVEGMKSKNDSIKEAAGDWGDIIDEALRDSLDINSPSRRTFALGKYSTQGLALGMLDDIGLIEKASNKLGFAINPSASPYVANTGANGNNEALAQKNEINIVVNGVVPDQLLYQAERTARRAIRDLKFV